MFNNSVYNTTNDSKASLRGNAFLRGKMVCRRVSWTLCLVAIIATFGRASQNIRSDSSASVLVQNAFPLRPTQRPATVTGAIKCDAEYNSTLSRSQQGEDEFLMKRFFKGICGGKYVELGALDGETYSNSFHFEFSSHWSGTLIEPNPTNFAKLQRRRRNNLVVNAAICDTNSDVHFVSRDAVGGIWEFMTPSYRDGWHPDINEGNLHLKSSIIKCLPLRQVLSGHSFYDFLSLDVEGAELEVLRTLDFTAVTFGVIFYENDGHFPLKGEIIKTWLESLGYRFVEHFRGSNYHVHRNFHVLYSHLVKL
jgi:FkbM family methyltransferase